MSPTPQSYTAAQLDGQACISCGEQAGPMVPLRLLGGGQLFAHKRCILERVNAAIDALGDAAAPMLSASERRDIKSAAATCLRGELLPLSTNPGVAFMAGGFVADALTVVLDG